MSHVPIYLSYIYVGAGPGAWIYLLLKVTGCSFSRTVYTIFIVAVLFYDLTTLDVISGFLNHILCALYARACSRMTSHPLKLHLPE